MYIRKYNIAKYQVLKLRLCLCYLIWFVNIPQSLLILLCTTPFHQVVYFFSYSLLHWKNQGISNCLRGHLLLLMIP